MRKNKPGAGRPPKPEDKKLIRKSVSLSQQEVAIVEQLSNESNLPMTFLLRKAVQEGLESVRKVVHRGKEIEDLTDHRKLKQPK